MAKMGQKWPFLRFPATIHDFANYLKMGVFGGILGVSGGSGEGPEGWFFRGTKMCKFPGFSPPGKICNFPPAGLWGPGGSFWGGPGEGHFGGYAMGHSGTPYDDMSMQDVQR